MTQIDRAIEALLTRWLSPKQISAESGRANPNGIIRDARLEAARRGLIWREIWVRNERGRRFKMHRVERNAETIAEQTGTLASVSSEQIECQGSCEDGGGAETKGTGFSKREPALNGPIRPAPSPWERETARREGLKREAEEAERRGRLPL